MEETTENKIWAWRKTRVKKNEEINREEMHALWEGEARLYDITHPVRRENPSPVTVPELVAAELQKVLDEAIEHCSERKVAFKPEEIAKFATAEVRSFDIQELQKAITSHVELLQIGDKERRVTTRAALARELATIRLMQQGQGGVNQIACPEVVADLLQGIELKSGQRQAVVLAATTNDQFLAWQGIAGAGKTFALKELKRVIEAVDGSNYNIRGFAPSAEAANVLGEEMGIEADTIAQLLTSKQPDKTLQNQIWIVDEAGLMGARDGYELFKRAAAEGVRLILVGDEKQLSSVEAGSPFRSLLQAGIRTAYLDELVRQKENAINLQEAVKLAAGGNTSAAIAHLLQVGLVERVPDADERAYRIADDYIKLDPEGREETVIIAGTNRERVAINKQIRELRKAEGSLGHDVEITRLQNKDLTSVQARYTHYYDIGDVVVPLREYRGTGLHKFQPYTVEEINKDTLTLSDLCGNRIIVDPIKFRKEVYTKQELEIAVGDKLRWTKNDKSLGRRNGQKFTVIGIEGDTATIRYKDQHKNDKIENIYLQQPLHVDHAYVLTTFSSQGKTGERTIASAGRDRTVTKESGYVAISRAKSELKVYVENEKQLLEDVKRSGVQQNPIELLQQYWGRVPSELLGHDLEEATITTAEAQLPQTVESSLESQVSAPEKKIPSRTVPQLPLPNSSRTPTEHNTPSDINPQENHDGPDPGQSQPIDAADRGAGSDERYDPGPTRVSGDEVSHSLSPGGASGGEVQPYQFAIGAGRLSDEISGFAELQEVERIAGAVEQVNRSLADRQQSITGPEGIRAAIDQLHTAVDAITQQLNQQRTGQLIEQLAEGIEQTNFELNLELNALENLTQELQQTDISETTDAVNHLNVAVNEYLHQLQQSQWLNAIASYIEEETVDSEQLAQSVSALTDQLEELQPQTTTERIQQLHRVLSNYLRDVVTARTVQQLSDGLAERIEQTVVDSEPLVQAMLELVEQLSEFSAQNTTEAVELLNQQVHDYQQQITNRYQSRFQDLAAAIADYIESEAIEAEPIIEALTSLSQIMSELQTSQTSQALEELNAAVRDYTAAQIPGLDFSLVEGKWVRTDQLTAAQFDQLFTLQEEQHEQPNAQQSQPIDRASAGTSLGERIAQGIESDSDATGSPRILLDGTFSSDTRPTLSLSGTTEAGDTLPTVELRSQPIQRFDQLSRALGAEGDGTRRGDRAIEPTDASPTPGLHVLDYFAKRAESVDRPHRAVRGASEPSIGVQPAAEPNAHSAGTELERSPAEYRPPARGNAPLTRAVQSKLAAAIEQLDAVNRQLSAEGTGAFAADGNLDHPAAELGSIPPTGLSAVQRAGAATDRAATDYRKTTRRIDEIVERHAPLERSIQQLEAAIYTRSEPSERADTTMAPAAETAVKQPQPRYRGSDYHLGQRTDTLTRRGAARRGGVEPTSEQSATGVNSTVERYEQVSSRVASTRESLAALTAEVRALPLIEVAERLGLVQDRKDKKMWRDSQDVFKLSINQKNDTWLFNDVRAQKGGAGAIDFAKYVLNSSFPEARNWLAHEFGLLRGNTSYVQPAPMRVPQTKAPAKPEERQPFVPPSPNEHKWSAVRQYLVDKRGLPGVLIDKLHQQGDVYADDKQNAVFLRKSFGGQINGAFKRGTHENSQFKGSAPGTLKKEGWFMLVQGEGQLTRMILTESPIDTISLATLEGGRNGKTLYISTDGAGDIPKQTLQQFQSLGGQVIVAFDADRAGHEMAWKIAQVLPIAYLTPTGSKDWNEQLLSERQASRTTNSPAVSKWHLVAQAIDKSEAYQQRVVTVTEEFKQGHSLSAEARKALHQDFDSYEQLQQLLWQWYETARKLGKPEAYSKRIVEVALAFNAAQNPSPLTREALAAMQQDLHRYHITTSTEESPQLQWLKSKLQSSEQTQQPRNESQIGQRSQLDV